MPPYADALTGLRGVAALWVLVFHLWQRTGAPALALGPLDFTPLAAHGYLGVDLFFVLSGYLIGGPWVAMRLGGAKVAFGTFWRRRFLRVLYRPIGRSGSCWRCSPRSAPAAFQWVPVKPCSAPR